MGTWIEPYIKSTYDPNPFLDYLRTALPIGPVGGFSRVALTGKYADLIDQPTIPAQYNPTQGTGIVISGTYPNQTISATSAASVITSLPNAASLGILDNGTDQTTNIQNALDNPNYAGITFDYSSPSSVTMNGGINCNGKILKFVGGSKIIGTGSINAPAIDVLWLYQAFAITITLTNATSVYPFTSITLFGATGNGVTDDQPAMQKHSDTVVSNLTLPRNIAVPPGTYKINEPWNLWNWTGTQYGQWNLNIIGSTSVSSSYLTNFPKIDASSLTTTFAINIQKGYGSIIDGLYIQGAFTTSISYDTFINTAFSSISGTRDSAQSPNSGIVIDAYSNSSSNIPADGGYPGLTAYYRGIGGTGGSTGITIRNCVINGFTIDICNSPNSFTQQGEDCIIDNCILEYCKIAIAYCQTQSDRCLISNCRSWYYIWTVIDANSYGTFHGYCANIEGYNVAGFVNTLFNIGAFKTVQISKFYAESFFQMGTLSGSAINLTACNFNFYVTDLNINPQYNITYHNNVVYDTCIFSYYDGMYNKRMRIGSQGKIKYRNCTFDQPPYICSPSYTSGNTTTDFENCSVGQNQILGMPNSCFAWQSSAINPVTYGRFSIQDYIGLDSSDGGAGVYTPVQSTVVWDFNNMEYNRYVRSNFTFSPTSITPVNGSATDITVNTALCLVNDIVRDHSTGNVLGRISAINTTAGTINLSEIPINITAGSYNFELVYYDFFQTPFLGDITTGSPNVTNLLNIFSALPVANQRGDYPGFSLGTYIVSISGTTVVMSTNATATAAKQSFINGNPQITVTSLYAPNDTIFVTGPVPYTKAFPVGTIWNQQSKWYFNTGGTLAGASIADYNIQYVTRIVGGLQQQYYDPSISTWVNI